MKIENQGSLQQALKTGVNLFLGAGFSTLAFNSDKIKIPLGGILAEDLRTHFSLSKFNALSLSQLYAYLESTKRDELRSYLIQRFSVVTYDPIYEALLNVNVSSIFTTNIDNLLQKLYSFSSSRYLNDITIRGPVLNDKQAIQFAPLHGSVANDGTEFVFSPMDLAATFSSDKDKWHFLTQSLQHNPTLFWGYSLADAGVLEALHPSTVSGRSHKQKWIVLFNPDDGERAYFSALDFHVIEADTREVLEYISSLSLSSISAVSVHPKSTKALFPYEALPDASSVPVRPIIEFYIGGEPVWNDIYSGRLYKTSYFSRIVDYIHQGKDVAVLGIPACGKSTLMMQIASDINFSGHKLVLDAPSPEKAHLMLKQLCHEKALCFIDNFADYIDAFSIFVDADNVTVVGFEREYNFEMASHKVDRSKIEFLDITDLSERDLQEIFQRIPTQVRVDSFLQPDIEEGYAPSLYEVIENNIVGAASLDTRYANALRDLMKRDQVLHDLFLMCCYVHSCRTPVSFDMAYAFLRGYVGDWKDAMHKIETLGALLTDCSSPLVDSNQDHYVPRSVIISEVVIKQAHGHSLKRMLLKFHEEVSPIRICQYNIFKRKAFDAALANRAFPNPEDGKSFYERMYLRDQSPYLLQQGALYLSKKEYQKEAFEWIDEAIEKSKGRIQSIKNTHAVLLFKANINLSCDSDIIIRTLKQSMDILAQCYKNDRRKAYHAITFADQALKYWERFGNYQAIQYLKTANDWLDAESKISPWHRDVSRLFHTVSRKLKQI